MTTRSNGPLAGFGWLKRGIAVAFRRPKAMLGGAALLLLAGLPQSLITLPIQFHAQRSGVPLTPVFMGLMTLVSMLFGVLLVPLYAGYLQMIDAAERGLPARAFDILKPYRQGEAGRLMGFGLAIMVIYLVMFAVLIAATSRGVMSWYVQMLSTQSSHRPPPALPHGFGIAMTVFAALSLFMTGFYAISFGQIALRQHSVLAAIRDGMTGALKNLLPLLVLVVSSTLAAIGLTIAFVIVAVVLALLAKIVSGWLVLVLAVPLYIALLLTMLPVIFGVSYHLWRDVCSDDAAANNAQLL